MCVQYAVDYPDRCVSASRQLDLFDVGTLTFKKPDTEAFPFLDLAREAITLGGAVPAVMNAADEIAVGAFLNGEITFKDIYRVVIETVHAMSDSSSIKSLDGIIACDREARIRAKELLISKRPRKA